MRIAVRLIGFLLQILVHLIRLPPRVPRLLIGFELRVLQIFGCILVLEFVIAIKSEEEELNLTLDLRWLELLLFL